MKVIKEKSEFGLNIFLKEGKKYITFTFGGNLDLYWSIHSETDDLSEDYSYDFFTITKENYGIYRLFEELFYNIENINLFDIDESIPFYLNEDEKEEYLKSRRRNIEEEKNFYRLYNQANYNELFDGDSKTITWYSDETAHEVANILKIKKEENAFKIEFYTQPYMREYDEDFHSYGNISIRFRNSGSSYEPFNTLFMRMYNDMQEVDDVSAVGHQMHIEEYLFLEDKARCLAKNKNATEN